MVHRLLPLLVLLGALAGAAEQTERSLCGAFEGRRSLELAKHRYFSETLDRGTARYLRAQVRFDVSGDLVLLEDDGTLVGEANVFDLSGRSLVFQIAGASRYHFGAASAPVEPSLGDRITIGDDATQSFDLAFTFRFFGRDYQRIFLNSDGNLTFERGDNASTERGLERFLSGPPRIAPFFADLDPSAGGQVRVLSTPDRFVVTWDAVPEWEKTAPNTFQVELSAGGGVHYRYGSAVNAASGIVGLSPGDNPADVNLVDLSAVSREADGATAERFQRGRTIDNVAVSRAVLQEIGDRYDALVLWTNFESDLDDAFAFAAPVSNNVAGIGEDVFDDSPIWGSNGELETFVFMGDVHRYPRAPDGRVFGAASRPTTLGLLAHEVGHRFLARALVFRSGVPTDALLGRQRSHWSFFLDSDASFLEGNDIVQESTNRFQTVETVSRYSNLDLYLMGMAPPSEVAPFFVVTGASASSPGGVALDNESTPRIGVTITGTRTELTIDDVVRAAGDRRPGFDSAQKSFRHAWVLLTRAGAPATSEHIAQLQDARNAFIPFFNQHTLGRGEMVTGIQPK